VADWDLVNKNLEEKISASYVGSSVHLLDTAAKIDAHVETLTTILQDTIQQTVPICTPSPFRKCWWTKQLTHLHHAYRRAEHQEFVARETNRWNHALVQRNEAHNLYNLTLCKTKNAHWKNWLENVNEQDIWRAGRFAKNPLSDGGCS
jgi:hypothetical protein